MKGRKMESFCNKIILPGYKWSNPFSHFLPLLLPSFLSGVIKNWTSQYERQKGGIILEQNHLTRLQMVQFECPMYRNPLLSSIFEAYCSLFPNGIRHCVGPAYFTSNASQLGLILKVRWERKFPSDKQIKSNSPKLLISKTNLLAKLQSCAWLIRQSSLKPVEPFSSAVFNLQGTVAPLDGLPPSPGMNKSKSPRTPTFAPK